MTSKLPLELENLITDIYVSQRRQDTDYQKLLTNINQVGVNVRLYNGIIDEEWYSLQYNCRYMQSRISAAIFRYENGSNPFYIPSYNIFNFELPFELQVLELVPDTIHPISDLPLPLQVVNFS
jgi:hypothetical protein